MNQQAVANTDGVAEPTPDGGSAPDESLDTLLDQYDKATGTGEQQPQASTDTNNGLSAEVKKIQEHLASEAYERDMGSVVKNVMNGIENPLVDEQFVKTWIESRAQADPRLTKAWTNRHADPAGFQKVVGQLGKQLHEKVGQVPDTNTTQYVDSMAAAVRGVQSNQPQTNSAPDYEGMSDEDFQKEVNNLD